MTVQESVHALRRARMPAPSRGVAGPPPARRPAHRAGREHRLRDLEHLRRSSPMSDAVLDEVRGRHVRSGDHWLVDFASCNYLGLDWDPEVVAAVEPALRRWGTHPSWSRLLGSPRLYPDLEERLAGLLARRTRCCCPP